MQPDKYIRSSLLDYVINGLRCIESFVNEIETRKSLDEQGENNFHGIFSESFTGAYPFASQEWYEAHRVMLSPARESLRFELIMICTPLIIQVMQLCNVRKHHITCFNFDATNICVFGDSKTGAHWNWGVDSH